MSIIKVDYGEVGGGINPICVHYGKKLNGTSDTYTIDASKKYIVAVSLNRGADLMQLLTKKVSNGSIDTVYDDGTLTSFVSIGLSGTILTISNITDVSLYGTLGIVYNIIQLD